MKKTLKLLRVSQETRGTAHLLGPWGTSIWKEAEGRARRAQATVFPTVSTERPDSTVNSFGLASIVAGLTPAQGDSGRQMLPPGPRPARGGQL